MELLIAFMVALGIITSGEGYTSETIERLRIDNHEILLNTYGEEYLSIIGDDDTEK